MRTIIDQTLTQKAQDLLIELKSQGVAANRLKAIIASFNHPIKTVADIFDVDSTTITRWANKLKKSGLKGLVNAPKHLDGIIVKSEHRQQVQKWLKSDPNITIGRVKIKLEELLKILKNLQSSLSKFTMLNCGYFLTKSKTTCDALE